MYEPEELHFMFDISIISREGETMEQTKERLINVMMDSFLPLADHTIDFTELQDL